MGMIMQNLFPSVKVLKDPSLLCKPQMLKFHLVCKLHDGFWPGQLSSAISVKSQLPIDGSSHDDMTSLLF